MPKKYQRKLPFNCFESFKPHPEPRDDDRPAVQEEQVLPLVTDAHLIDGLHQAQESEAFVWTQVHIGNSSVKDLSSGISTGGGAPLEDPLLTEMETAFYSDFSNVRIHNDGTADRAAETIESRAFTIGNNIYFRNSDYAPSTSKEKKLMAHELAHVVQQYETSSGSPTSVTLPDSSVEREADYAAGSVVSGDNPQVTKHPELAGAIARDIDPQSNPAEQRRMQQERDSLARSRSQLYSEFSREVLHRIRISREAIGADPPDYRLAAVHMDYVYGYCEELSRRSREAITHGRSAPVEQEQSLFSSSQPPTMEEVMAELPVCPESLIPALIELTEAALRLNLSLTNMVIPPEEEAGEEAGVDIESIVSEVTSPPPERLSPEQQNGDIRIMFELFNRRAIELWQMIRTQF